MLPYAAPDPLYLNPRTLQVGGPVGWVDVSDAECTLLKALIASTDQRLDKARILARVDGQSESLSSRTLGARIVRLRKKLEQAGAPPPTIKAIHGVGYQLCVPIQIHPSCL